LAQQNRRRPATTAPECCRKACGAGFSEAPLQNGAWRLVNGRPRRRQPFAASPWRA